MNRKRLLLAGFTLWILLLLSGIMFLPSGFREKLSLPHIKALIESVGVMAPIVFIGICILRGVTFLPCGILSALGGMVFGKLRGTIYTLVGLSAGSVLTFYLAREIGRDWVKRILRHRYDTYEGYISRDFPYSIFLMRVVPILPYDAVSCIAGVSGVRVGKFMSDTLAGSIPGVFIYVYFGDSVRSMSLKRVVFSFSIIMIFAVIPFFLRYLVNLKVKSS